MTKRARSKTTENNKDSTIGKNNSPIWNDYLLYTRCRCANDKGTINISRIKSPIWKLECNNVLYKRKKIYMYYIREGIYKSHRLKSDEIILPNTQLGLETLNIKAFIKHLSI